MATRRIGIEVGKSYAWTHGNEQIIVTALASPWAEERISELEAALREIAVEMKGAHDGSCVYPVQAILARIDWQKPDNN